MRSFALIAIIVAVGLFVDVLAQCRCNCRRQPSCSCCRPNVQTNNNQFLRVCSSTCADTTLTCNGLGTLCSSTLYRDLMLTTCPCSCGLCNATTTVATGVGACAGVPSGQGIGPCIPCVGGTCTNGECIVNGVGIGPCQDCQTPATCSATGECTC